MILGKIWGAFRAQLNKIANLFWEADPIAQMRYEYDLAVEQLKEGRQGLEMYRGLVERVSRQVTAGRSHASEARGRDQGLPESGRSGDGCQVRPRATKGQEGARGERRAAQHARDCLRQQPQEDQTCEQEARRSPREDPKVRCRAQDECSGSRDRRSGGKLRHEHHDRLRTARRRSSSRQIDANRGKARVATDLSAQGIEEIEAEERMEKAMADQALAEFEVELGLVPRRRRRSPRPQRIWDLLRQPKRKKRKRTDHD